MPIEPSAQRPGGQCLNRLQPLLQHTPARCSTNRTDPRHGPGRGALQPMSLRYINFQLDGEKHSEFEIAGGGGGTLETVSQGSGARGQGGREAGGRVRLGGHSVASVTRGPPCPAACLLGRPSQPPRPGQALSPPAHCRALPGPFCAMRRCAGAGAGGPPGVHGTPCYIKCTAG